VVVDRDSEGLLGCVLPDDILVKEVEDFLGLGQVFPLDFVAVAALFFDDLVAQIDALVTDVDPGAGDQLGDLLLALPAERTLQKVSAFTDTRQRNTLPREGGQAGELRDVRILP
jgi:hypothetical protein